MVECRVLVVDDDETFAASLVDALASEVGIDVVGVAHGVTAGLESARLGVDVALVDFKMPGGGGAELARRLGKELPGTVVVGMSGTWDRTSREAMTAAGAVATVDKSAAVDEVLRVVGSVCGSRSGERSEQA